jgi:formylglycine-generating enzyme required for sulfatase activity
MKIKSLFLIGLVLLLGSIFQGSEAVSAGPDKGASGEMALIPAGPFWMGLDDLSPDTPWGQEDARPKHEVILPAFYIDRYEVAFGDYQKIDPALRIPGRTSKFPVTDVTWLDADRYCRAVGKRLPTEAEWEKAARGTDARAYPWGDAFDPEKANTGLSLMPAGGNPNDRSPYGVFDMAGNVSEWTDSWYQPYPGSEHKSIDFGIFQKVVRGGSYNVNRHFADEMFAQVTFRNYQRPDASGPDNGFRCAKSAPAGNGPQKDKR